MDNAQTTHESQARFPERNLDDLPWLEYRLAGNRELSEAEKNIVKKVRRQWRYLTDSARRIENYSRLAEQKAKLEASSIPDPSAFLLFHLLGGKVPLPEKCKELDLPSTNSVAAFIETLYTDQGGPKLDS